MDFEFEEKETYTLEEVKELVEGFKTAVEETIKSKDTTIQELNEKVEGVEELQEQHQNLSIKNLMLKNNIDDDLFDLVADDDLEVVETKIEKLKSITKEKEIDESFKPEKKRNDDQYEKAIQGNDVESAIKFKFNKLFQ